MHQSGWFCSRFPTMHCGRGTHVCPAESGEIRNTVCSQTSTCLTCWPWCYRAQPCHTVTSVTHGSLSSLPQQPTLLPLTHWHKFCLTARLPSFCLLSTLSLVLHILYCCLSSRASVFFPTLCNILSHFCSLSPRSLSLSLSLNPPHLFPDLPPVGSRRAAGDDSCISSQLWGHFSLSSTETLQHSLSHRNKERRRWGGSKWKILKNSEMGDRNMYGGERRIKKGSNERELLVKWNSRKVSE